MKALSDFDEVTRLLAQGSIVAYPTEAVLGLGCDPFNEDAVSKLLALKQRPRGKGLILLIHTWSQLLPLIAKVDEEKLALVKKTWPGPVTWVFPKSPQVPDWVSGDSPSVAIRMSAHPIASALCKEAPIISTSANVTGFEPARTAEELSAQFPYGVDGLVPGELGNMDEPSAIFDLLTGNQLR